MAGALKTLFGALQASQYMTGVSLVFGEEEVNDQAQALPMVVVVPTGGPFLESPAYSANLDPWIEQQWGIRESVDLYLWNCSTSPTAIGIDHVDSIESLRQLVLSALQDQRAQYTDINSVAFGLWFKPVSQRWQLMQGAWVRFGRALVITVQAEIAIPMAAPQEATINSETLNFTITQGPS